MIAYEADTGGKILVLIYQTINQGIYSLINTICQLFINISETTLFSDSIMNDLLSRIYVVLGIFMLFKLAFSLLSAIVNPDALLDKEKGMQKIVPRTIIALMLLITTPTIFEYAIDWQSSIAMAVPRIIIGKSGNSDGMANSNQGELLATAALKAFINKTNGCEDPHDPLSDAQSVSDTLYVTTEKCGNTGKVYRYQFNGFVSMFVGIFLVVMLASYCIDIAIRTIKIGLLRVLAPIPIITYIDPKSEKNGAFGNWLKECISTYLELFIKLAILYFVLYILGGIASGDNQLFNYPEGANNIAFINLFLIMGSFFFMGKAAEFICNILGIKKPEKSGGFLKGLAGIAGAAAILGGGVSSAINRYKSGVVADQARGKQPNRGRNIAKAILGAGVGMTTAAQAVATSKGINKFTSANKKIMEANAKSMTRAAHGGTWLGDKVAEVGEYWGHGESTDVLQYQISKQKDLVEYWKKKGNTKGKGEKLDFAAMAGDGNYDKISSILNMMKTGGTIGNDANLGDLLTKVNEARSRVQHGGSGTVNWAGVNFDVNNSNVNWLVDEVTTLAGLKAVQGFTNANDIAEADSYYKAAGRSRTVNTQIKEVKDDITAKENKIRSLKK